MPLIQVFFCLCTSSCRVSQEAGLHVLACCNAACSVQVLCDFSIFDGDTGMWVESVPTPYFLCCHSCVALPIASQAALPPSTSPLGKLLCC